MIGIGVLHSIDYNVSLFNPPQASAHRIFWPKNYCGLEWIREDPSNPKNFMGVYYGPDDLKQTLHILKYRFIMDIMPFYPDMPVC